MLLGCVPAVKGTRMVCLTANHPVAKIPAHFHLMQQTGNQTGIGATVHSNN